MTCRQSQEDWVSQPNRFKRLHKLCSISVLLLHSVIDCPMGELQGHFVPLTGAKR